LGGGLSLDWGEFTQGAGRTLHVSIARGQFLSAHRDFCASADVTEPNYFEYVGQQLGKVLLQYMKDDGIWAFSDPALSGPPVSVIDADRSTSRRGSAK